ncbi:hypothetical protein THAOC_01035 [Thalassiosira oceanica]|uniref:Uncharacterized protein n=1 Tax=Thalassiosira oceanica TaxID=159749 RepID=K0TEN1_THAOC|nr:hypothetical protein THAOC_01035 [Thalassiosira oceanica]|eukprot:EJK77153.1 hypothetical protein THAOC_01035 [Thalassiosira oceanica]
MFSPSKQFLGDLIHHFQHHVPGGIVENLAELLLPFLVSQDWTVIAAVLGPDRLFGSRKSLANLFGILSGKIQEDEEARDNNYPISNNDIKLISDLVVDMLDPSFDFDTIVSASILLVNKDGLVIVPFTATHIDRRREGVAHYMRNYFVLVRNFFGGSTDTPVITNVISQSNCIFGLFAARRNTRNLGGDELLELSSGDETFNTLAKSLIGIRGMYAFCCSDWISEEVRPMPPISGEDQSNIETQNFELPMYVNSGPVTLPTDPISAPQNPPTEPSRNKKRKRSTSTSSGTALTANVARKMPPSSRDKVTSNNNSNPTRLHLTSEPPRQRSMDAAKEYVNGLVSSGDQRNTNIDRINQSVCIVKNRNCNSMVIVIGARGYADMKHELATSRSMERSPLNTVAILMLPLFVTSQPHPTTNKSCAFQSCAMDKMA